MHKGPQIPLSSTSGKRLARCLAHPCAHKRELVPSRARQHPLPLPRSWGCAGAPSRLHSTGREQNSPHTHTRTCLFFLFVFCGRSSTPTSHDRNQPGRERRAAFEAKSRAGGSGRKPAPLRAPRHPQGEGQRLCRQAERRDSPLGEREMPPPALGLSGPDSSAAPARPPGAAAAAARGGGAAEPGASSQLAKKASPRQSCLTIKGARPRHS